MVALFIGYALLAIVAALLMGHILRQMNPIHED